MKIYVASSWRNERQPEVVRELRAHGHEVYDFRNPPHGDGGFNWREIDEDWQDWSPEKYRDMLSHPIARRGFLADYEAMKWADAVLLLMLCGRSAHLEAGWFIGMNKPSCILLSDGEPELMNALFGWIAIDMREVLDWAKGTHGILYDQIYPEAMNA